MGKKKPGGIEITVGGKKIDVRNWTLDRGWAEMSGSFDILPTADVPPLGTDVTFDLGDGIDYTGIVVASRSDTFSGTSFDVRFPKAAIGSGVYDPSIMPPGITATTGAGYKITGKFKAAKSWMIPISGEFAYGDVVHHKANPEQREMVVLVSGSSVHTVILDNDGGNQGEETTYAADVLVRVE